MITEAIVLSYILKNLYKIKRFGNSLFTYNCISCGKNVRGNCLCKECSEKLVPSGNYFNGFQHAFYYEGPAKEVVLCYKFGKNYEFCYDTLCDWLMLGFEKFEDKSFDAVVPVPSYKRKRTRLFELSKKFSLIAEVPFRPEYLKKIRKTEKQRSLSASQRRVNLIDAFEVSNSVLGKTILLVDDIFTTGSTAAECANAFYDKGAEKVFVLTILKTRFEE